MSAAGPRATPRSTSQAPRLAGIALAAALAGTAHAAIDLVVDETQIEGEVELTWAGEAPDYAVYRSTSPVDVADPAHEIGQTAGTSWIDAPPAGELFFYKVESLCPGTPETCNGADDDCDGTIDNGNFEDVHEPNDACAAMTFLGDVGSDATATFETFTLYPDGDVDVFRIRGVETDSSCACCDAFCTDEDYRFDVELTVPAGAGSYRLCLASTCDDTWTDCVTVNAGSAGMLSRWFDGSCAASDAYDLYIRVEGFAAPGFTCAPYRLEVFFDAQVCQ